jgi:hypothetical protein
LFVILIEKNSLIITNGRTNKDNENRKEGTTPSVQEGCECETKKNED